MTRVLRVKIAVSKINLADYEAKDLFKEDFFATLTDVPAGPNLTVKYRFDLNVSKDAQISVFWRRYYELGFKGDRKVALEDNLYFE